MRQKLWYGVIFFVILRSNNNYTIHGTEKIQTHYRDRCIAIR